MILDFAVDNQTLTKLSGDALVANSQQLLDARFTFSPEWDGLEVIVHFRRMYADEATERYIDVVLDRETNKCRIPHDVLIGEGTFIVGLYGQTVSNNGVNEVILTCNEVDVYLQYAYLPPNQLPYTPTEGVIGEAYQKIRVIYDNWDSIKALNDNITSVVQVADRLTEVVNVGSNIEAIINCNEHITEITAVGDHIDAVLNINDNIPHIIGVGEHIDDVINVSDNIGNVADVSEIKDDVVAVASVKDAVSAVGGAILSVSIVAANIGNINNVADNIDQIKVVSDNIDYITPVGERIDAVINTSTHMEEIIAAPDFANKARIWAEGTDEEVEPLGGEHSAKGWAQHADDIVHNRWGTITGNIEDQEDLAGYIDEKSTTKRHSSDTDEFGGGNTYQYGHVKLVDKILSTEITWSTKTQDEKYPLSTMMFCGEKAGVSSTSGSVIIGLNNTNKICTGYVNNGFQGVYETDSNYKWATGVYANGVYVIAGLGIASSEDTRNWKVRYTSTAITWVAVVHNGKQFFAYGNPTPSGSSNAEGPYVATSDDGAVWNVAGPLTSLAGAVKFMLFDGNKFIAGTRPSTYGGYNCYHSVDGMNFIRVQISIGSGELNAVAFGDGKIVLSNSSYPNNHLAVSTNGGVNWKEIVQAGTSSIKYSVACYGNGRLIVVSEIGSLYEIVDASSGDASDLVAINPPIDHATIYGMGFADNKFFAQVLYYSQRYYAVSGEVQPLGNTALSANFARTNSEEWTFTLADGTTVTKKVMALK